MQSAESLERHLLVMRLIMSTLDGSGIDWALTGSLGLALQGVAVSPGDIDLQTDAAGAYRIEELLPGETLRPVAVWESETARTHFGQMRLGEIVVDIIGGWQIRSFDGYGPPIDIRTIRHWVAFDDLTVPVLDLHHQAEGYERLGRHDRAELIRFSRAREPLTAIRSPAAQSP